MGLGNKPLKRLRVGIAGSGTAGPAVAALLAKAGHSVTLFERAPRKEAIGAGFLLQPTGMVVLERLNILEPLLTQTAKINRLYCENLQNRILLDLPYEELKPGLFGCGTFRPLLLDLLLSTGIQAGVNVQWDRKITRITDHHFTDHRGSQYGPFDLLLICDGARSSLRHQIDLPSKVTRYPWGALWFIGKRTPEFSANTLWQAVDGTEWLAGFLPTGKELLSVFWSIRSDELSLWQNRPVQAWKDHLLRLVPQAETFLAQISSIRELQPANYYDVRMKKWHHRNVAILGDAGHALSPQLGQGVNLALMDAAILADCLEEFPLESALQAYSQRRRNHLRFYQWATRWTTPFFQSDLHLLAPIRDATFPVALQVPWLRKQMLATMAGIKTGPLTQMAVPGQFDQMRRH